MVLAADLLDMLHPKLLAVLAASAALIQSNLKWEPTLTYIERQHLLRHVDINILRSQVGASDKWQMLRNMLLECDAGFWAFVDLLFHTGQTALYQMVCPVTSVLFPELNAAITPAPVQQSANNRYTFSLSAKLMAIVGKDFGIGIVELVRMTPKMPEFVSLSISQLMVAVEYMSSIMAVEGEDFRVIGRLGPLKNHQFGLHGNSYNPDCERHQQAIAKAEPFRFTPPAATKEEHRMAMDQADGVVMGMAKVDGTARISFYSVIATLAQRLITIDLNEFLELVKFKPLFQSLMFIIPQLPTPTIVPQLPIISEEHQRIALGVCIEKFAQYLKFLVNYYAEQQCPGCFHARVSSIIYANHEHMAFHEAVDKHIGQAYDYVNSIVGREKFKRLVFNEPVDPFHISLVLSRFLQIPFSTEMLCLLVKYVGPKKLTNMQKLYLELILDTI